MLAAEGEELLYIATHGPFEKGKDVITRARDGSLRAYQLKSGDIRLAEWREIGSQINNLVELPVNLPQWPKDSKHLPFFVTSGRVDDVVLDYINTANLGWSQRGFQHPLAVIERSQLVHRFVAVHGAFLPQEAKDFQMLLTLLLADGASPIDKATFSQFLLSVIRFEDDGASHRNLSRSLSSAVLLTSYILGAAEKSNNHWATFEGWIVMASHILGAATKFPLADEMWRPSFNLAMLGAQGALDDLVEECRNRDQFIEGPPIVDGYFYGPRQMILAGLLSAWALTRRRSSLESDEQIGKIIRSRVRESVIWGESSAPFVLVAALELEQQCDQLSAEEFVLNFLRLLLALNAEGMRGMPDSFTSAEDAVRFFHRLGEQEIESFQETSYSCQTVVDFLVRRWRRQALARIWEEITRLSLDSSIPQLKWEWFFWKSDSALLESCIPGQPQSWSKLVEESHHRDTSSLPPLLLKYPIFALFWLLVYPHRLTPTTFALIDKS